MAVYYNEIDGGAAAWLRELMTHGLIPQGEVDERSIADVAADDLRGFHQAHFFAGIGGWAYALMLAGWGDRPVWTGSCPCQPFSQAGKRKGVEDERHLWPEFARLIGECRPSTVFGEQVASPDGRKWLSGVRADLEAMAYAVGAADLCAAGVGAPHIRQRLYWVADAELPKRRAFGEARSRDSWSNAVQREGQEDPSGLAGSGENGGLGDANSHRRDGEQVRLRSRRQDQAGAETAGAGGGGWLGSPNHTRPQGRPILPECEDQRSPWAASLDNWLPCADGKWRRIEPGLEPLVDRFPARVGLLRGYGNAIVPQVAATFVKAVM